MPRFHVPEYGNFLKMDLDGNPPFDLPKETCAHIKAFRLKDGNYATIFTGDGFDYNGHLSIEGRGAKFTLDYASYNASESPLKIILAQAMTVNDKMDFVVQKAVELGAMGICPIVTERSQVRISEERRDKKTSRYLSISAGAAEQSGRSVVPFVRQVEKLADFLKKLESMEEEMGDVQERINSLNIPRYVKNEADMADIWMERRYFYSDMERGVAYPKGIVKIILDPFSGVPIKDLPLALNEDPNGPPPLPGYTFVNGRGFPKFPLVDPRPAILILIGPEGGFSPDEMEECLNHGFMGVNLGPRVLRTETAALSAISALQAIFGDFSSNGPMMGEPGSSPNPDHNQHPAIWLKD